MANFITAEFGTGERYDIGIVNNRQELIDRLRKWDVRVFGYNPDTKKVVKRAVFASGQTVSGDFVQVFIDSNDQVFNDPPLCDEPPDEEAECISTLYTCVACKKNPVNPIDGEDTCYDCIHNV